MTPNLLTRTSASSYDAEVAVVKGRDSACVKPFGESAMTLASVPPSGRCIDRRVSLMRFQMCQVQVQVMP